MRPTPHEALGVRDRTMLELMYASGLRVSELVGLKVLNVSLTDNVLRVFGKGNKERLVPFGEVASLWLKRYLAQPASRVAGGHSSEALFVTHRGSTPGTAMSRVMFWMLVKKYALLAGHHRAAVTAHAAPCLCHPFAQPRRRPARGADCCWVMWTFPPPPSTPMWRGSA